MIFLVITAFAIFAYDNALSSQVSEIQPLAPQFKIQGGPAAVTATAFTIFDLETGSILAEKAADKILPIASVTKLVTAATLTKEFDLETVATVTVNDVETEGRAGKLAVGDTYSYRELLFPLLLESSNDAAALFERTTKSELTKEMNHLANKIGMKSTTFADASGLSDHNLSTAEDLSTFLTYLYKQESYVLDISSLEQYVGTKTGWINNSPVRNDDYVGGKHGFTTSANRTLIALFEEDFPLHVRTIGYVLLGSEDLAADVAVLRNFVANNVTYE